MTIDQLVQLSRHGDLQAFGKLVEQEETFVFRVAFRMLGNEADARDAVQDCFLRVWKRLSTYNPKRCWRTWLYAVISNCCCDMLRQRKRRQKFQSEDVDVNRQVDDRDTASRFEQQELVRAIRLCAERLHPRQQMVFVLRDLEELELEEIAMILKCSVGSVRSNLYYARKNI